MHRFLAYAAALFSIFGVIAATEDDLYVGNGDDGKSYVVTGDAAVIGYLQSRAPDSMTVKVLKGGIVLNLWEIGYQLTVDGQPVYGVTVRKEDWASGEQEDADPPEKPEDQICTDIPAVFEPSVRAMLVFDECDWGANVLKFITDHNYFTWSFEDRKHVKIQIEGNATYANIVMHIPRSGKIADVVGEFYDQFDRVVHATDPSPWSKQQFWDDYVVQVLQITDSVEEYKRVVKIQREAWQHVLETTHGIYMQLLLAANVPGSIIMGWSEVQQGNYWGLVDMLPVLPVISRSAKAGWKVAEIVLYDAKAIDMGLRRALPGVQPLIRFAKNDLKLLQQLKASVNGSVVKAIDYVGFMSSKFGTVWPEFAMTLCRAGTKCLDADARVWTRHGLVRLRDLGRGSHILSIDEANGQVRDDVIEDLCVTRTASHVRIVVAGAKQIVIRSTSNHIFQVSHGGELDWCQASELKAGDHFRSANGELVEISAVETVDEPLDVVDLSVATNHNFLVESVGIIAHNKCPFELFGQLGGGKVLTGFRNLLQDEALFNKYWPGVMASYRKSDLVTRNLFYKRIRDLMYDVKRANHEWIPRQNVAIILDRAANNDVRRKLFQMMHEFRTPVKDIWFTAKGDKGMMEVESELVRAGHTTNDAAGVSCKIYSTQFHNDLQTAFEKSLVTAANGDITGFKPAVWQRLVEATVLSRYFQDIEGVAKAGAPALDQLTQRKKDIAAFVQRATQLWAP